MLHHHPFWDAHRGFFDSGLSFSQPSAAFCPHVRCRRRDLFRERLGRLYYRAEDLSPIGEKTPLALTKEIADATGVEVKSIQQVAALEHKAPELAEIQKGRPKKQKTAIKKHLSPRAIMLPKSLQKRLQRPLVQG